MPEIWRPGIVWRYVAPLLPPVRKLRISEFYAASAEYRSRLSDWLIGRWVHERCCGQVGADAQHVGLPV